MGVTHATTTKELLQHTTSSFGQAVNHLRSELEKLQAERAHPRLLEHILVESGGESVRLQSVASITAVDNRTLVVKPWMEHLLPAIRKGIVQNTALNLDPQLDGNHYRIVLPVLTEERRKELVKEARKYLEQGRTRLRHAREEVRKQLKNLEKGSLCSKDEVKRTEKEIEKQTKEATAELDKIFSQKEESLMRV